jgi:tetrahydromethanopterin S-methyltransferase subunit G
MQEEKKEIIEIKRTLRELTAKFEDKFDELSKSIGKTVGEQQEYAQGKISENPLAYMAGAF